MSAVWRVLGILAVAVTAVVVLDGWYRRLRYRRREREARAATQQARDARLLADLQARTWTDGELAALRRERSKKRGSLWPG